MKGGYFILLVIICAALAPGAAHAYGPAFAPQQTSDERSVIKLSANPQNTGHATGPDGEKNQQVGNSANEQSDPRDTSGTQHRHERARVVTANRSKRVPNNRGNSASTSVRNRQQPSPAKPEAAAKDGFIRNEAVRNAAPVRPPAVARPAASSLNTVRHRGANPAIVGGPGSASTRNTAVIDGTHMNHRGTGN